MFISIKKENDYSFFLQTTIIKNVTHLEIFLQQEHLTSITNMFSGKKIKVIG